MTAMSSTMMGYSDADRGSAQRRQPVRHVHVTQELRDGKLVILEHKVFERGMAEPADVSRMFDPAGWQAWLARESGKGFREAA